MESPNFLYKTYKNDSTWKKGAEIKTNRFGASLNNLFELLV